MKVSWRTLGTVLLEDEILDKAFSRAKKAADRVDENIFLKIKEILLDGSSSLNIPIQLYMVKSVIKYCNI